MESIHFLGVRTAQAKAWATAKDETSEGVILQLRAVRCGVSPLIGRPVAGDERHQYRAPSRRIAGRLRQGIQAPRVVRLRGRPDRPATGRTAIVVDGGRVGS